MSRLHSSTQAGFDAWRRYVTRLDGECLPGRDAAACMLRMAAMQRGNVARELAEGRTSSAYYSAGRAICYLLAAKRHRAAAVRLP